MKRIPLLLFLLVVLAVQTGQPQSQPNERVSLDIGLVTVWLGMPKAEVVKKFSEDGYDITDLGDGVIAHSKNEIHDLRFKNARLVFADLEWYNSNNEEIDAVVGALGALADKTKSRPCLMSHDPFSKPEEALDRIFISCGDRSVLIANGKAFGKHVADVSERIGQISVDTQN